MRLYPVIMCGGEGRRLWPSSRPARPKQFMVMSGGRSLFQEAALRVASLAGSEGELIVVGGVAHADIILTQLAEIDVSAQVLLEPEPRDSAAAMAAAAAWTAERDPDGINVFVAADHRIPDHAAFCEAVQVAAIKAAEGRIVTLGVAPTGPSTAFGYIAPVGEGLAPVSAFVEKPDAETAMAFICDGYLWNTGNFIAPAQTVLDELARHAPMIGEAAVAALPPFEATSPMILGSAFIDAPSLSFDHAVMQTTDLAWVLPVAFAWSDLGSWDAVAAAGDAGTGSAVLEDAPGCLVRVCEGVVLAVVGVSNLAIIIEPDAVLVCDLSRSQDVKRIADRLAAASPASLAFARPASVVD